MRPPFTLPKRAKGFPYWKRRPAEGAFCKGMSFFRAEEARRPRPKRQTRCRMHPRGTGLPWHKGNFSEGRFCNKSSALVSSKPPSTFFQKSTLFFLIRASSSAMLKRLPEKVCRRKSALQTHYIIPSVGPIPRWVLNLYSSVIM